MLYYFCKNSRYSSLGYITNVGFMCNAAVNEWSQAPPNNGEYRHHVNEHEDPGILVVQKKVNFDCGCMLFVDVINTEMCWKLRDFITGVIEFVLFQTLIFQNGCLFFYHK